jgi:ATP-dependent helicase YprA (DUF1998 family)
MSVFTLHSSVVEDYRDFVRSFFSVADDRAREFIDHELLDEARLWPEALLQVSPSYARVASVDELADRGVILPETAQIFRTERGSPFEILELNERGGTQRAIPQGVPFHLYQHQVEALDRAGRRESYVVTSGTGSGKSLTYFLPIIDSLLRLPSARDRVAALVVYPMNALVNSQLEALKKLKRGYEQRTSRRFPISFAKYTGDVQGDARREVQTHPPQILLTNYVMAGILAQLFYRVPDLLLFLLQLGLQRFALLDPLLLERFDFLKIARHRGLRNFVLQCDFTPGNLRGAG